MSNSQRLHHDIKKLRAGGDYSLLSKSIFVLYLTISIGLLVLVLFKTQLLAKWVFDKYTYIIPVWVAVLVVIASMIWIIRKRSPRVLAWQPAPGCAAIVTILSNQLNLAAPPVYIDNMEADARVIYKGGKAYIVVPKAMEWLARLKPEAIRPILAHELAHIANNDAKTANISQKVLHWLIPLACCIVLLDGLLYFGEFVKYLQHYGIYSLNVNSIKQLVEHSGWIAPYLIALLLAYAAFLRMREFEADHTVCKLGLGEKLQVALENSKNNTANILRMHPSRAQRIFSIRNHSLSHEVEHQTIALVVAAGYLFRSNYSALPDNGLVDAYGITTFVLVLVVLSFLGLNYARREIISNVGGYRKIVNLLYVLVFMFLGSVSMAIIVDAVIEFTPDIPIYYQAWEALVSGLIWALCCWVVFASAYLVGTANSSYALPGGVARPLWLAICLTLSVFPYYVMNVFIYSMLHPYGLTGNAYFWSTAKKLRDLLSKYTDTIPVVQEWPISYEMMVSIVIGVSVTFYLSFYAACSIARYLWLRIPREYHCRTVLQVGVGILLLILVGFPTYYGGRLVLAASEDIRMQHSMWVSCAVDLDTEDPVRSLKFAESIVDYIGNDLRTVKTRSDGVWIGMLDSKCNQNEHSRYPAMRHLLTKIGLTDDSRILLSFTHGRVTIEYWPVSSDTSQLIYIGNAYDNIPAAYAVAWARLPYRHALKHGLLTEQPAEISEQVLLRIMEHPDPIQRAWGHNWSGRLKVASDPVQAQYHLQQAITLYPTQPVFRSSFAEHLLYRHDCDAAGPYVKNAAKHGELSAGVALTYARCLSNKGRAREATLFLWRSRTILGEDPLFIAALGEAATWAGFSWLGKEYSDRAFEMSDNGQAPACSRFFHALYANVDTCNADRCKAPITPVTADEKWCWSTYAHRYGHKVSMTAENIKN